MQPNMTRPTSLLSRLSTVLGLMLLLPCASHAARAGCWLDMPARVDLAPAGYRPNDPNPSFTAFEVGVEGDCSYAMGAESNAVGENLLTGPGGTIPLTISLTSPVPRALRNLPLAAPAELMTGDVGIGGGWTRTTLWGVLPAGSNLAPGNYTGRVNFMLYAQDRNAPASYTPSASRTVTLSVNVLAYVYAQLEIDGVASDFGVPRTLDLGELVAGAKRSFKIRISSNTRYKLSALSSNNGNLLGRANNGLIPYTLRPFGLEDFANGRSVSFNIEIGKLNNAPPGIYTDEVQLTVTAL